MAFDDELKNSCRQLYIDGMLAPEAICRTLGVSLPTFYRWRKEGNWEALRDFNMGLREKVGQLMVKMIDDLMKAPEVNAQQIHALVNMLKKYMETGAVRERVEYVEDAELLFQAMKKVEAFNALLEDEDVMKQLELALTEIRRG